MAFAYAPSEEALAAIAAGGSVVLASGFVPADGTVGGHAVVPLAHVGLCRHDVFGEGKQTQKNIHDFP